MTPSIRTFLLINLLLSVTLITSLAIIGNLFLAHNDIQTQLDLQLIRTTIQIESLFSDGIKSRQLGVIQNHIESSITASLHLSKKNPKLLKALTDYHEKTGFQIWNNRGKLILHSKSAPKIPLSDGKPGLTTLWLNAQSWRVFTVYNKINKLTIIVGERSDFRQKLENQLTQDSILIMLITYPFLGFLIWVIVGRGLDTLKKVAREVSHRAPSYLEPVDVESVPSEIEPLVVELNSLFTRLQEAFDREKRFAADAAHELRTPLAALRTQTQVALRADTNEDRDEALRKVLEGVDRATHVVQQLLTLSRMLPQSTINEPTSIDLSTTAADVAAQLVPIAIEKNIDLELIAPNDPALIRGNATSIGILIRNLVDNAIRYTPPEGSVVIEIQKSAQKVTLNVIDSGPGIPKQLRDRVFERFFRVIGNKAPGSGLGLGIVQQIARLHQAEIQLLTPASGKGLEFRIIFPAN
ncbi:MAG: ATP-binding protein [Coxiellaceae bacterium]|nr:ATP-binding protein [Coxiellaceae bacterium]